MIIFASGDSEMNPLLPPLDEIVIGGVAFLIVFGVLWKFLLPGIAKTLADRTDAIEGGLRRAEEAQAEAQAELERYRAELSNARRDAGRIQQQAQEQGASVIAESRAEAQRIRDEIVASGHAQIEAERSQAKAALRQDVGKLAIELAGRIVGESLEDEARQRRVVERFLDELEAKAAASTSEKVL